jgi:transcriptional regulator with XRE-family HTH domain
MSDSSLWLSPRTVTEVEANTTLLAEVLLEYRKAHGISQADLAQLLSFDQSYISKIEKGQRQVRDIAMLLRIAQQLDIPPAQLGISGELLRPVAPPSTSALVGAVDPVRSSQQEWCSARRRLNQSRGRLARVAAELYRADVRCGSIPFMAHHTWMPRTPMALEDITLEWSDDAAGALITGGEAEAARVLPLRVAGRRFTRYTSAIRYLDAPALFENRPSYRLLHADLSGTHGHMRFGLGTYFDKLDLTEAVAHELALASPSPDGETAPSWATLPLRALVGDPFDLRRRFVMPAIETLTIRRDRTTGNATFLLHWRDPAKVATAAGIYGLIPAGEFQPSSIATRDRENDFDIWRNMVREYSEEILGEPEHDGSSAEPIDYQNWQLFRTLQEARDTGHVSVYCLGIGLDTLTLAATILTVTVLDSAVFDDLFGDAVQINTEGILIRAAESSTVSEGLPFTSETVRRLLHDEPMASPGAYILDRAWHFRHKILTP